MRLAFYVLEFAVVVLLLYFLMSQLIVPAMRGTALFPFFRRERKLKEEILDVQQEIREDALEDQLDAAIRKARRIDDAE
jgi:hypothetical protein